MEDEIVSCFSAGVLLIYLNFNVLLLLRFSYRDPKLKKKEK